MTSPTSQNGRPVLPSIQDLLSDREFDKLRLQSPDILRNVAPASDLVSQCMARDSKAPTRHEPILRTSCSPPIPPPRSPKSCSRGASRSAPYPDIHPSRSPRLPETAGKAFEDHLPGLHLGSRFLNTRVGPTHEPGRLSSTAHQTLAMMDLPTYVLSPDQCPPDDDRRHGCGICHRRFNRPSSLMIHMNSHTGAQPFKCPFPGCTRRFSVNSNMRRHYRNHREGAAMTAQSQPYPTSSYHIPEPPRPYYSASSASSSPPSSPSHTDDGHFDTAESPAYSPSSRARSRSRSTVLPRAQDRPSARPRACTVPGCHCDMEAPGALRPAFQQGRETGTSTRPSPKHR